MTSDKNHTAVIIQPMFFPWRGQFDLQSRADTVVIFDTAQYVRGHWYNRNRIATRTGPQWISVPVDNKGHREILLKDIVITKDNRWRHKLINTVRHAYVKSPYFDLYFEEVKNLIASEWKSISDLSCASIFWAFEKLGKSPNFVLSSNLNIEAETAVDRLVALCQAVNSNHYISGPAAKSYIGDDDAFDRAGITLEWMSYDYTDYPQIYDSGKTEMSILDLLFNTGPEAPKYIWSN
tara:strand:- start:16503 stop:17210 length:708 start_codon:yes stop_codon:yes gene_type:complete